jgi:hypothetical protein
VRGFVESIIHDGLDDLVKELPPYRQSLHSHHHLPPLLHCLLYLLHLMSGKLFRENTCAMLTQLAHSAIQL